MKWRGFAGFADSASMSFSHTEAPLRFYSIKIQKYKNTKIQKYKNTKMQKNKPKCKKIRGTIEVYSKKQKKNTKYRKQKHKKIITCGEI